MPSIKDLQQQIFNHNRRLQVLKEKEAFYGASVESSIVLEIEDIETKLDRLNAEIDALRQAVLAEATAIQQLDVAAILQNTSQPTPPRRVFISYKRHAEPDESLATLLYQALERLGHQPFIDQRMKVGVAWAAEIKRQIEASDFVVVFLSEASVNSEMVAKEVKHAHHFHRETGRARLLPVRVKYTEPLPYQLSHYLEELQYAEWRQPDDTERVIEQMLEATGDGNSLQPPAAVSVSFQGVDQAAPLPFADPRFIDSLRDPSGAVRLRSEFYVERDSDALLSRELSKQWGTITTIRAPRQTGKSSLLVRGIAQARQHSARDVLIDLQHVDGRYLADLDLFLRYFCDLLVAKLRLDPAEVEKQWQSSLGPSDKATYLLEGYLLPAINGPLVLAIDEADRLLSSGFHDTFFGLLRFWDNQRAMSTNELWENLDMILAISTEPHLLISDVTQSPFNVGLKIRLQDFDLGQVQELNRRYRAPVAEADLPDLFDYLGGHPYLTRRALFTMVTDHLDWPQLKRLSISEHSPFGDHLRRYLWLVSQQPDLRAAVNQILRSGLCADEMVYYRLLRAGLIAGPDGKNCRFRCQLYEAFFESKL